MKFLVLLVGLLPTLFPIRAQEREMALIPIQPTRITIPGGHGSQWETNFVAYNSSDRDVFIRYLDSSLVRNRNRAPHAGVAVLGVHQHHQ